MRLATQAQAKRLDELTQKDFGIPAEDLMEEAGSRAARFLLDYYSEEIHQGVVIVCGRGNNGGDGLVVARHLRLEGAENVSVVFFAGESSPLFRLNFERLQDVDLVPRSEGNFEIPPAAILVDAFLGIGVNEPLRPTAEEVISSINRFSGPVVSLDVPSGIQVDTGWDWGAAVRASETLTFGISKPGLHINRGYQCSGEVVVLDIGFPPELIREICSTHFLYDESAAARMLPVRNELQNKTHHGRLAVVAGSPGMWGAGVLAGKAAYRSGAGYVHLLSHEDPSTIINSTPEILTGKISDFSQWEKTNAWAVGPGLGASSQTTAFVSKLMDWSQEHGTPAVLDADALTALSQMNSKKVPQEWVLTPHAGEMSRLIQKPSEMIELDRFGAVAEAVQKYKGVVLLKGFHSIVGFKDKFYIINSGNPALAKAGTGDVLSGLIGGLLAQGLKSLEATLLGGYLHGLAADIWVRDVGHPSALLTSELIEILPKALQELSQGKMIEDVLDV